MNLYEHTIITKQDVSPSQIKQLIEKYSKIVEKLDGDIVKTENWGRLWAFRRSLCSTHAWTAPCEGIAWRCGVSSQSQPRRQASFFEITFSTLSPRTIRWSIWFLCHWSNGGRRAGGATPLRIISWINWSHRRRRGVWSSRAWKSGKCAWEDATQSFPSQITGTQGPRSSKRKVFHHENGWTTGFTTR